MTAGFGRAVRAGLIAPAALAIVALAFTAMGCSSSSVVSGAADVGNAVPAKDFVGSWTSTVAQIDGTWNGTTGTFTVSPNNIGGGIVVAQSGNSLTAQLIGNGGSSTPAFRTVVTVDTLSFSVPDASGSPVTWDVQIPDPTSQKALLQVGPDSSTSYDLEKVSPIPTGQ
jgi:hypothetical protein